MSVLSRVDPTLFRVTAAGAIDCVPLHTHRAENPIGLDRRHFHCGTTQRASRPRFLRLCRECGFQFCKSLFERFHPFRQLAHSLPDRYLFEDFQNV